MIRRLAIVLSLVFGCITASAVVRIDGDTVVCLGAWPITLSAASGLNNYLWNTGQRTASISISGPGTYKVTAYRNGVLDSGSITIREAPPPFPDLPNDIVYVCRGDVASHQAPTHFLSYSWSNGQTTPTVRIDSAGWYRLTVTDGNGCRGSDSMFVVLIDRPTPTIKGPYTVCNNSRSLYETENIPGAVYLWNVVGGVLETGQGTSLVRIHWPSGSGAVEVRVSVPRPDGGFCDSLVRLPVRVGPRLQPFLIYSRLNFCDGDSTVLDAGGSFGVYRWSTGETTQTIVVKTAGKYWVEVTDASGCSGTSDTVNIIVTPPPVIRIIGDSTLCPGQTTTLTGLALTNNVVQWQWSNGLAQKTIFVSTPGTYTVVGRTAAGCLDTASVTVIPAGLGVVDAPDSLDFDSLEVNSGIFLPFVLRNKTAQTIKVISARLASGRTNPSINTPTFPDSLTAFGFLSFLIAWTPDAPGPYSDTILIELDGPECPTTLRIPIKGYRFFPPVIPDVPVAISIGDTVVPVGTVIEMPIRISIPALEEEVVDLEFSVIWNDRVFHVTTFDNANVISDQTRGSERTIRYRFGPLTLPIDTVIQLRGTALLGSPLQTDLTPDSVVVTGKSNYTITTDPGHIAMTACFIAGRLVRFTDAEPLTIVTNLLGQVVASDIDNLPSGNYMVTTITGTTAHTHGICIVR